MYPKETVREETVGEYVVKVVVDLDPVNPRTEYSNLGTMICFHRRYSLGDKHGFSSPEAFDEWIGEVKGTNEEPAAILPLFLYDHGGITISSVPFSDRWDSGQVGFVYIPRESARKEFGRNYRKRALACLEAEIKTYDECLRGNIFGYQVWHNEEQVDSCYGFIGEPDYALSEGIASAKSAQASAQTGEVFANLCFAL